MAGPALTPRRSTAGPAAPPDARASVRQVVAGITSGFVLVGLLVGLPMLLTVIAPLSSPSTVPGWHDALDALGRRDDGSLLVTVLTVLAWGAWLVMAASVLLEIVSVARRRPTPRIPLLKVPQQGAAALVAAVALVLSPVGGASGPTPARAAYDSSRAPSSVSLAMSGTPAEIAASAAAARTPFSSREVAPSVAGASVSAAPHVAEPTVRVQRHDTLWALAERHLGSGPRFHEIVALNQGRPQADGRALTDAHWIYPGWVLRLPPDAVGAGASSPLAAPAVGPAAAAVDRGPDLAPVSGEPDVPHVDRPAGRATQLGGTTLASAATPLESSYDVAPVVALGLGALTIGGVLAEVARQRRRRQGSRAVGDRLPQPVQRAVTAERLLRSVADDGRGARIRAGLACLASACSGAGRALPDVAWLRVSATTLELVLAADDEDVVAPFVLTSPRTWSWSGDIEEVQDPQPDPYPALVSVGLDGDELVLVNLEAVGTLQVAGEPGQRAAVMSAMTVDLMGRARASSVTVSVVPGVLDVTLPAAAVRTVESPEAAGRQVDAQQRSVRDVLGQCDVADVRMARSSGVADETWVPEVVLGQDVAATAAPWSGAAVVRGGGPAAAGEWALRPEQGELWRLDPPGIAIVPQRLEPDDQQDLALLVHEESPGRKAASAATASTLAQEIALARAALERVPSRGPGESDAPRVLLLGPVEVTGVDDSVAPGRRRRAAELVAYLVLHPGASRHELDEVLWPGRRVGRNTRNPFVSRTRQWLGRTPAGDAYLPLVAETGEYRLREEITSDWNDFVAAALHGTRDDKVDVGELREALGLVRGRPFQGIDPVMYGWADPDVQEMVSAVVDVAHLLAAAAYASGDLRTAAAAAARGLTVDPGSELLHRDALLVAHGLGDGIALERAACRLRAQVDDEDELMPETLALLDELGIQLDL
jgi:DNA-binding SARP family transcriptional activator